MSEPMLFGLLFLTTVICWAVDHFTLHHRIKNLETDRHIRALMFKSAMWSMEEELRKAKEAC